MKKLEVVGFVGQFDLQVVMAFDLIENRVNLVQGCLLRQLGFQLENFDIERANEQVGSLHVVV